MCSNTIKIQMIDQTTHHHTHNAKSTIVFVTSVPQQSRVLFSCGYNVEDRRNAVAKFLRRGQISMEHNL